MKRCESMFRGLEIRPTSKPERSLLFPEQPEYHAPNRNSSRPSIVARRAPAGIIEQQDCVPPGPGGTQLTAERT